MQSANTRDQSSPEASGSKANASKANASRAMQMLEEGITRITSSEEFKRYLSFTRSFREYSPNNIMLIWLQCPDATMVAGYKKWKEHGRQVKKGEKAIKILAPVARKEIDEESGEEVRRVVGFRDANVFAAEQTEGDPLPSPPLTGNVEAGDSSARRLHATLSRICEAEGVPVAEHTLRPGHYGYHDPLNERIVVSTNIPEVRKATTLAHELCHYFLHPLHISLTTETGTKETEAEGASFAICEHFGIDTSAFSFPYIARHAEDPNTLQGVVGRIQKVVGQILDHDAQATGASPEAATEICQAA